MAKLIKRDKWIQISLGIIITVAGLVTAILAIVDKSLLNKAFSIIVAVSLFVLGAILLVVSLLKSTRNIVDSGFVGGSVAIALGVTLCVNTALLPGILIYVIAITVLSLGVAILVKAIIFCVRKVPTKYIVLGFVIGAILIAAGILALIFQSETQNFLYIVTGVALIVVGVLEIVQGAQSLS